MYRREVLDADSTRMELLPTSAPVYGGGLIVAFLPEDYLLPEDIRAFLVFKGSKQRQVTEAKVSLEDNAFHAVIPDHEPPEPVDLSVYVQFPNQRSKCIGSEEFAFYLDQTCYLARYLADSVHDLDSLEDWDSIQGDNFSLEHEDFATLDERLTSAFQHLILPPNWNLLGDPGLEHIPRETLFHFASRLGLSTFVTLLLEKPGAAQCLQLKNRHDELAKDIANERGFDGLADLITDPHAHGVIRWESKEKVGQAIILKRHSFGTVSTTSECRNNVWPPLDEEITALSKTSPPATPIPYQLEAAAMWSDDLEESLSLPAGNPQEMYYEKHPYPSSIQLHPEDDGDFESPHYPKSKGRIGETFLKENLKHLHEISDGIHHLRHQDMERLQAGSEDELARLSNSCPDLAKNLFQLQQHQSGDSETPGTPQLARNRRALPLDINEKQLEAQLLEPADNFTPRTLENLVPQRQDAKGKLRYGSLAALAGEFHNDEVKTPTASGEPSPTSLHRRHSWHSAESLDADAASPSDKKRFSFHEDDDNSQKTSNVVSPTVVRRAAHKNMTMFSVVAPTKSTQGTTEVDGEVADNRRSKSVSANSNNNSGHEETDRRYTISEGVIPDSDDATEVSANLQEVSAEATAPELSAEPSNSTQNRPPVPPRPAKKIVTRKLSFLDKMKSARNKPKEKTKLKTFAEMRFGEKVKEEKENLDSEASKESKFKGTRPPIITRPHSMMLNLPTTQYSVGTSPNEFPGPNPPSRTRPISTLTNYPGNPMVTDSIQMAGSRTSFLDEEDGGPSSMPYNNSYRDRDRISGSYESLDEASLDIADIESDSDLAIRNDEPDSWSATIDKKTLKRLTLTKKDIKRQENIFEFIQTERNHLTTLKIMQKVYARGLTRELRMDNITINKLFPRIDEHVEFVGQFLQRLTECQNASKVVCGIGDTLVAQWSGENGENNKRLFGDFCSKKNEITNFYKELLKSDKKFQSFMKKWDKNPITRRQDVPACALLITQRVTKYPIMLQTMLENSNKKDHKEDYQSLEIALDLSREMAKAVNEQVQAHERQELLLEIYDKTESKSSSTYKDGRKFDRKDLLKRNRKLLHSATVQWNVKDPKKFTDIYFLLLSDCIVFLQDNNGKYSFPSGQSAVVPLQKMIVREVAGDDKSLYLMSMTTQLMYTLKLASVDDCKTLIHKIRIAIGACPDEDEGITSEDEMERRMNEKRMEKAKQAIRQLELTDQRINRTLEEKMRLFKALAESVDRPAGVSNLHFSIPYYSPDESKLPSGTPILLKAAEQVTKLSHAFYGPGGLSRHPSSAGEHESSSRTTPSLPKRSDTFGGFDNDREPPSTRPQWLNSSQSDSKLTELEPMNTESSKRDRDSGLIDSETATQHSDSQSSIPKAWEPCADATSDVNSTVDDARAYVTPTSDQANILTSLAYFLSEYQSVAAQQDTLVEKLQHQLSSQDRSSSVSKKKGAGLQEAELKRNQIKQQEQMDDLRKQQHRLRTEREQWQKQVERFQRSLDNDRKAFEEERAKITVEKEENEKMRIETQKIKDDYQRELARLRESQRKIQHENAPSGFTPSLTPTNRNSSNNVTDGEFRPDILKTSRSSVNLQSSNPETNKKPPSPSEYPRTFPGLKRDTNPSASSQLPIHLKYSATNQLTAPAPKHQDISKLTKLASSSKLKPTSSTDKGGIQQLLPGKLSSKLGHNSSTSLENLKHIATFGHHKRKHANTLPESALARAPPTKRHDWLQSTNSNSPTPMVDVSVERTSSSSSSSSREEERSRKASGKRFNGFKAKHESPESPELFL